MNLFLSWKIKSRVHILFNHYWLCVLQSFNTGNQKVMPMPKIPITANEYLSPASSEMYPIRGGPIKKPRKLTLETVARAIPAGTLLCFPAAL